MNEKINTELLNLQNELQKLGQAVSHIQKAEEISTAIVDSVKQIPEQYVEHLTLLTQVFKDSLENYKAEAEQKFSDLHDLSVKQVQDAQNILADLEQKSNSIQQKAEETLQKAADDYDKFLDQNFLHTKHQMEMVAGAYQKRVDDETEVLSEFTRLTQKTEQVNQQFVEKQLTENASKITVLVDSHQENIDQMTTLLNQYEDLGKATSILFTKINEIDFPVRFNDMGAKIDNLETNLAQYNAKLSSMESEFKKHSSEMNNVKYMLIILLVFVAALVFDAAMHYLP
jgi:hypothetical protein